MIDFSKAPEGATHYKRAGKGARWFQVANLVWYRYNGDKLELWDRILEGWYRSTFAFDDPRIKPIPTKSKPVAVKWDGTDFPPVGCECEMLDYDGVWVEVEICAKKGSWVVGFNKVTGYACSSNCPEDFRPIKDAKIVETLALLKETLDDYQFFGCSNQDIAEKLLEIIQEGNFSHIKWEGE